MSKINEKITKLYNEYIKENGEEPLYASCEIAFKGEGSFIDTIKLSTCNYDDNDDCYDDDDEDVFYYCNDLNGLLSLTENGVEDFVVKDVDHFFN